MAGWGRRADLIVATYSSVCGTGARSTTFVFTGKALGAGCVAACLLHPKVMRTKAAQK